MSSSQPSKNVPQSEVDPRPLALGDRSFAADVRTIIAKALDKDPGRRYQTASELGADIERALRDEPITARPASMVYQLRKLARRHRILVGASAAVLLVLVLGIAGTATGWIRARAAEDEARLANEITQTPDPREAQRGPHP